MLKIGDGSFAPTRRRENLQVSNLADQGLLLTGEVTVATINAFCLTRQLNPQIILRMYVQAGLLPKDTPLIEDDRFPAIYRSQQ